MRHHTVPEPERKDTKALRAQAKGTKGIQISEFRCTVHIPCGLYSAGGSENCQLQLHFQFLGFFLFSLSSSCVAWRRDHAPRPHPQQREHQQQGHQESRRQREGLGAVRTTGGPTHGGGATVNTHPLQGRAHTHTHTHTIMIFRSFHDLIGSNMFASFYRCSPHMACMSAAGMGAGPVLMMSHCWQIFLKVERELKRRWSVIFTLSSSPP